MFTGQATQSVNYLVYAETMHRVVGLLESHMMIPTSMSLDGNGWTEVIFITAAGQPNYQPLWQKLAKQGMVEIKETLLEISGAQENTLRVKFRVSQSQVVEKSQPSRWGRLKRLVS